MTAAPTVLAVVIHRRSEQSLDHCLRSLLEQTRPPDAIVVVDDGSPEPPADTVRRYRGVTLLRSSRPAGDHRLIEQVMGDTAFDWYLLQGADDWSAPHRLDRLLEGAVQSGAEAVTSHCVTVAPTEGLALSTPADGTGEVSTDLVRRLPGSAGGPGTVTVPAVLCFRRPQPATPTAPPDSGGAVVLDHLGGPALGARARQWATLRGIRNRLPWPGRSGRAHPALIVGGPGSGAETLLWALGQHRDISSLLDVSWMGPLADAVSLAEEPTKLRQALEGAVSRVLGGDGDHTSGWLGLAPPDDKFLTALLRFLPDLRVIHLVRDADQTAAVLTRRSATVTEPMSPEEAYRAWLDSAAAGLACERAAGSERLLRVRFDEMITSPGQAVARCLRFLGAPEGPACARFLEWFEPGVLSWADKGGAGPAAAAARELSTALCGPSIAVRRPAPAGPSGPVRAGGTARPAPSPVPPAAPRHPTADTRDKSEESLGLPTFVARPTALLRGTVPAGSVVAVVTKGEDAFRDLDGLDVRHFPQTPDGEWAGYHPASTEDIVNHLEELRRGGARYFLIPDFASWWLEHYAGLRAHLLATGRLVAEAPEAGSLFELGPASPAPTGPLGPASPALTGPLGPASPALTGPLGPASPALTGPLGPASPERSAAPVRRSPRRSVSVISWDTTHNPLGRAHVLAELLRHRYDVEIVGGRFENFGTGTWPPLRDMDIPLRSFPGAPFPEFLTHVEEFARSITSDAVVVSKPRLPSLLLGIMAKALGDRPLILDVDDRELPFVGADGPASLDDVRALADDDLVNPYGRSWTQLCESLVGSADHVTVSNHTLQALFGGTIVPHARDERVFDPSRVDREAVRARLGFAAGDRVILFGGTPRRHKGVVELAEALAAIGDPRARLCLIGTAELDSMRADLAPHAGRLCIVPPQPFDKVPELLAAADVVAVLQDPASEVSRFQMPAKLTDALAMQVPCVVRRVAPLEPLIAAGHVEVVGDESLAAALARVLGDLPGARERARANRELFLSEYSHAAVRPRLEALVDALVERPPSSPPVHREVLDLIRNRFGGRPASKTGAPAPAAKPASAARRRYSTREPFDVVMFWKQHDTGLYGRRHDMLMNHLARSPRVGQVVEFDAPVEISTLTKPEDDLPTHTALLRERALARVDGFEAAPGLHQYSFVYSNRRTSAGSFPGRDEFIVHVKDRLARHGLGERPVVFWVYPRNEDFPELARTFAPDLVVADVVDDHRTWLRPGAQHEAVLRNYEDIVSSSDVVLVNCEPMQTFMGRLSQSVHLVPNAAEYPDPDSGRRFEVPPDLRSLRGPIVGYSGNLSSRIDVELLDRMAGERHDWNVVLMGSSHAGRMVAPLTARPNVVFLGPRPYDEAKAYLRAFDVGIIPHVDDAMTRAMNPLKAFVYCAQGVPVVSTDISNLGDLRSLVSVASNHADFIAKVEAAIQRGRSPIDARADAVLRRNSWETRTNVITDLVDAEMARRGTPS